MNSANLMPLLQRMHENDETALSELYNLFYKKLLVFAKSIVRTKELAEEAVEDVFIKLWTNRASAIRINNLNVYLYTAAKNASLNILSSKSGQPLSASLNFLNIDMQDCFDNPYQIAVTSEMMHKMQDAVSALPSRCRLIFRLIREDGLKYKEVSEILNVSINTIDSQMAIAVKKICAALNIKRSSKRFAFYN